MRVSHACTHVGTLFWRDVKAIVSIWVVAALSVHASGSPSSVQAVGLGKDTSAIPMTALPHQATLLIMCSLPMIIGAGASLDVGLPSGVILTGKNVSFPFLSVLPEYPYRLCVSLSACQDMASSSLRFRLLSCVNPNPSP